VLDVKVGRARTCAAAEAKLRAAIASGAARKLLARVIAAQHGDRASSPSPTGCRARRSS
jgi:hypothetical protein